MIHKTMKGSLQEAEKRKGTKKESGTKTGIENERGTRIDTGTGTVIAIENVIAIRIDTGTAVREGSVAGTGKMMIITTAVDIMKDEGIMLRTERIGIDVLLVPGPEPDLITDQGHALIHVQDRDRVHVPKVKGSADLIWLLQLRQCWPVLLFLRGSSNQITWFHW
uniref:Uncharacterized protein n=1 Tax=Opuntia streptacantha TaxID=393608 RepID=A0A7C9EWZ8_OPUST